MTGRPCDAIVIGAGPYGLAAAAHLRAAGAETRVFGGPMEFWAEHMPAGMRLRSGWNASHISDPRAALTLDAFERDHGSSLSRPVPLRDFISYGRWFQQRVVPDVDVRYVERVEPSPGGFRVVVQDGEPVETRRVVVATGLARFTWRPPEFDGLPPTLCTHSSDHADLSRIARGHVVVIGAGQSALESAVLLLQAGADVEVIMRAESVRWLGHSQWLGPLRALLFPRTDVGPAVLGHIGGRPPLLRRLPKDAQRRLDRLAMRPAVAGWLRRPAEGLAIVTRRAVKSAHASGGRIRLLLGDGTVRDADHVLLATGYRVDIARHEFLASLLPALRLVDGYPLLDGGFESSIRGLYFLGAPAARAFGPVVRFVAGTDYAARALVYSLTTSLASMDPSAADRLRPFGAPGMGRDKEGAATRTR